MNKATQLMLMLSLGLGGMAVVGCDDRSDVDRAVDKTEDAAKDAGRETETGLEKAGDEIEDAAEDAGDAVKDATR